MIIAAAKTIYNLGFNPQQTMFFSAVDIDKKCFEMTFIQTSLLGLCGEVVWGDTISLKTWRTYKTLLYYSDSWQAKFFAGDLLKLLKQETQPKIEEKEAEVEVEVETNITKTPETQTKTDLMVDKENGQIKLNLFSN